MPVFKNHDADGKLLETISEPLSEKNIDRFICEIGAEKAQIYLEALAEFTNEINEMRFRKIAGGARTLNSPQRMNTLVTNLFHRNKSILDLPQAKIIFPPDINSLEL